MPSRLPSWKASNLQEEQDEKLEHKQLCSHLHRMPDGSRPMLPRAQKCSEGQPLHWRAIGGNNFKHVYAYTYRCIHIYIYTYIHIYIYIFTYLYIIYISVCVWLFVCLINGFIIYSWLISICLCKYIYTEIHMFGWIHLCMHVCTYLI